MIIVRYCLVLCLFLYIKLPKSKYFYCFIGETEMKIGSINASLINDNTSTIDGQDDGHKPVAHSNSCVQSSRAILTEVPS